MADLCVGTCGQAGRERQRGEPEGGSYKKSAAEEPQKTELLLSLQLRLIKDQPCLRNRVLYQRYQVQVQLFFVFFPERGSLPVHPVIQNNH